MSFPDIHPSPPVTVVTPNTSNLPHSSHHDSGLFTVAHVPSYASSVQPTLPQVLHAGHNIDPTTQTNKPSLEDLTHLLTLQTQNQQKIMAEQSQQQQLLFHLLSKLAPQHCTASVNPHTTSTVNASKEPASSAVYAANTADLMKEYDHDSLGVLTSSSHLKGIDTPAPLHSSVSVAVAPQQSSLDIDSELVHVLQQQKSKALEATSNGADGQPFSAPTHKSLLCVRKGCSKPSSGPLVKKNNNFNGVLPTIFEVEDDPLLEPNSNSSNPPCQNHFPQTLPTGLPVNPTAQSVSTAQNSASTSLPTNLSAQPIGKSMAMSYEGNKGKFNKGRDASGIPSSSGQQPTAKYNPNQHKTPGNKSTQVDTYVAKASHAPQLTISTTSHIEPMVTSEQVEPTFALNVQQSSPSTSKLPLSNTTVYTASSPTSLEPFNVLPSNNLDIIVPETYDLLQTQLGTQQPSKQKHDNKQMPTETQEPQPNSKTPKTANKFAPLSGIFWDDDDSDDHLLEQVPTSPPPKTNSPSHIEIYVALEQDKGPPILGSSIDIHKDNFLDESTSDHDTCSSPSQNISSDSDYIPSTSCRSQKYRLQESDYLPVNKPISNKKLKKQAQKVEAIRLELHEAGLSPQAISEYLAIHHRNNKINDSKKNTEISHLITRSDSRPGPLRERILQL
ncbi:hypothetical protein LguiB_018384 [Lonicera macranthoides]